MRRTLCNRQLALILAGSVSIAGGGFAPLRAEAQPTPESVTVSMVEGWNLVGWTGDDTPILTATADIAHRFDDMQTFDAESGAVLRFRDGIPSHENTLTELRYGMGVWVLAGEQTTWVHTPRAPSTTVALGPGFNLVAWLGDDDTPVATALAPLGAAVLTAHSWDRAGQRFRRHADTGETAFLNENVNLMRGDSLWLEMAAAADWAQATPGADAVSAVVDADGAILNHADGVSVDVPPGALPVGTPMSLFRTATPPNLPGYVNWVGQTYEISAGAALDGFATLRVPVPAGEDPAGLELFRLGAENRPFPQGAVLENSKLVAQTASFSLLRAGASNPRVSIIGPQLVLSGNTVEYLIGDTGLADNPNMIAKWEFENAPGSDIFPHKTLFSFTRSRLVTFKAGATGSGTIRVKLAASPFTASGEIAVQAVTTGPALEIGAPILDGNSKQIGDSIDFSFTAFGGTPPYDFEIDFDEGDPVVECLDCTSTISRSNLWETPGLKTVVASVTDANLQFATARYSVAVAASSLDCRIASDSDQLVPADTPGRFKVEISGGTPGYTVDWLLTSFSGVGGPQPDPQFVPDEVGKDGKVIRTYEWRPNGEGTYDFVAVVSDALGAECRRSLQVRVLPFGITLIDPPVGVQKGAPFTLTGTLSGVTGDCFIRFDGDDGKPFGGVVTTTGQFTLPDIKLDRSGTHELTVKAACLGVQTSVKHLIQVLDGQAMWVRGFPVANPFGETLLVSDSSGSFDRCRILLPKQIAYSLLRKVSDGMGGSILTSDLEYAFAFDQPPLRVVPGTAIDLNLSGVVTGFSNGSRAQYLRLSHVGTLTTSSEEAVVKIAGGALADPTYGVTNDARTATAEFPLPGIGAATGSIDIKVDTLANACMVRWPYVRIPASTN